MRTDPAFLGRAAFRRVGNDCYATIDPRCVGHLDKVWPLRGWHFVEPCAGYGDMIRHLEEAGAICDYASDLHAYDGADPRIETGVDVMLATGGATAVITNPPFNVLTEVTERLLQKHSGFIILLMRASQMHVGRMRRLMTPRLHAVVPLPFRPQWFPKEIERKQNTPRHEFMWLIFRPVTQRQAHPIVLLGDPS